MIRDLSHSDLYIFRVRSIYCIPVFFMITDFIFNSQIQNVVVMDFTQVYANGNDITSISYVTITCHIISIDNSAVLTDNYSMSFKLG